MEVMNRKYPKIFYEVFKYVIINCISCNEK